MYIRAVQQCSKKRKGRHQRTNEPRTKSFLLNGTSSGARAMRGFGAMCLLRKSRRVFLAPQCAALRCPWMSALLVPVVRVPSCACGPPCVFFTAHVQQICTTVQYCRYIKNDDHQRTTKFHLIERIPPVLLLVRSLLALIMRTRIQRSCLCEIWFCRTGDIYIAN